MGRMLLLVVLCLRILVLEFAGESKREMTLSMYSGILWYSNMKRVLSFDSLRLRSLLSTGANSPFVTLVASP
jgi:hypothetical protein